VQKKSITEIILEVKLIQKEFNSNSDIVEKLDLIISDLEKNNKFSIDKNIDRSKKVSEILALLAKIIHDYFGGS